MKYPRWLGQIITYKGMSFYPKALQVSNQTYLNGYWQSEEYFASISPVIRHEVQLKAPFSLENNHWVEKASQPFAVSVHIRRADYVHDTLVSSLYSVCTPDYYRRAAAFLIQKIPQAFFVIFSDDLPWAHKNLDILSPACFVDAVGSRKDEEELMMMSLCRHHIIANSSFSWWGAWLGEKKGSYIIVPNQWFNKLPYPEDLVPERWMKI
ncbi:MAG: alpha-1,2-fucosyltransferase [Anaerolineaceae bacterium]|nr:alpha-1,2-fucosyltransferase [Anaerolineaceae bacterium]